MSSTSNCRFLTSLNFKVVYNKCGDRATNSQAWHTGILNLNLTQRSNLRSWPNSGVVPVKAHTTTAKRVPSQPKTPSISTGKRRFSGNSLGFPRLGYVMSTKCQAICRTEPRKRVQHACFAFRRKSDHSCPVHIENCWTCLLLVASGELASRGTSWPIVGAPFSFTQTYPPSI